MDNFVPSPLAGVWPVWWHLQSVREAAVLDLCRWWNQAPGGDGQPVPDAIVNARPSSENEQPIASK